MESKTRIGSVVALASIVTGALLHFAPAWARRPEPTSGRWETVTAGSARGVAWMSLREAKPPEETGGGKNGSYHMSDPFDFIYRLPSATSKGQGYLVAPDGRRIPLSESHQFADPRYHAVQPTRNYPPDTDAIEIEIRGKGLKTSRFRMVDLPRTRERFAVSGPEIRQQTIRGVRFEAVAWRPKPKGSLPYVAAAVRLPNGFPAGGPWEWRNSDMEMPFASPKELAIPPSGGSISNPVFPGYPGNGWAITEPWASAIPRVRLRGSLAHYLSTEEVLDFGPVSVIQNSRYARDNFRLALNRPLVARGASGLRIRLEPIGAVPMNFAGFPAMLHLRAVIEGDTDVTSLPPAMRATGRAPDLDAQIVREQGWMSIPAIRPVPKTGETTYLAWPGLKPGRHRLRMTVRRRVVDREYPFDLRPNVQRRDIPNSGLVLHRDFDMPMEIPFQPTDAAFVHPRP